MKAKHFIIIYSICFLLLSLGVYAEKKIMTVPGSIVINGKNISTTGFQKDFVNFDVDGVLGTVQRNTTKKVNGVSIYVVGFSRSPARAILEIVVAINCGDKTCSVGEDSAICCTDCGCLDLKKVCSANRCIENITRPGAKNECFKNADCKSEDSCKVVYCDTSAYPNTCKYNAIEACISGDACCPQKCDIPEDTDCANVDKCEINSDCRTDDACATTTCAGTPKRCSSTKEVGCSLNNQCVSEGTIDSGTYCLSATGIWEKQKADTEKCEEDYECASNTCSLKSCGEKGSAKILPIFFIILASLVIIVIIAYIAVASKKR